MSFVIINADDFGRASRFTDASLSCFQADRISSVSAMVFMEDSIRAAEIAKENEIDVGLHLNLDVPFTGEKIDSRLLSSHKSLARFLSYNKYALLVYNPFLIRQFRFVFNAQYQEFKRLYGKEPTHIDGHHHLHLCTNMIVGKVFPRRCKIRRNFTFIVPKERTFFNLFYRQILDLFLCRGHITTDYLFGLPYIIKPNMLERIAEISKTKTIEIMTHPIYEEDFSFLMSNRFSETLGKLRIGTYVDLL